MQAPPRRRSRLRRRIPPLLGVLLTALLALAIGLYVGGTRSYVVPSNSMVPTLLQDDQFLVDVRFTTGNGPRRGEIWVLNNPHPEDGNGEILVKRIVALPGDTVAVARGKLLLNGAPRDEPYVREPMRYRVKPVKLGAGDYWVLGDNRNQSGDSHTWGAVGRGALIGRAFLLYWPPGRFRRL